MRTNTYRCLVILKKTPPARARIDSAVASHLCACAVAVFSTWYIRPRRFVRKLQNRQQNAITIIGRHRFRRRRRRHRRRCSVRRRRVVVRPLAASLKYDKLTFAYKRTHMYIPFPDSECRQCRAPFAPANTHPGKKSPCDAVGNASPSNIWYNQVRANIGGERGEGSRSRMRGEKPACHVGKNPDESDF